MSKIRGKEIKIKSPKDFNISLGTVNNKNPKCIYFEIKGWIEPKDETELNYASVVKRLTKRVNTQLYNHIQNQAGISPVYLLDFDLRDSGIQHGKRSYYNCEVTLFQEETIKDLESLKPNISKISTELIQQVLEPFEHFNFYKKKK